MTIQSVAATLYTFSNTGANPYSFSFLEPGPLTASGAFAIAPFQAGGLTFTQAALGSFSGGTDCFQFGTAGASLTVTPGSCGVAASAADGGWQSLFIGAEAPGSYIAFNASAQGSAPGAPDHLTIVALAGPTPPPVAAPEPAGMALIMGGLALLMARRRRRS